MRYACILQETVREVARGGQWILQETEQLSKQFYQNKTIINNMLNSNATIIKTFFLDGGKCAQNAVCILEETVHK
jgi:hypothetical protein